MKHYAETDYVRDLALDIFNKLKNLKAENSKIREAIESNDTQKLIEAFDNQDYKSFLNGIVKELENFEEENKNYVR